MQRDFDAVLFDFGGVFTGSPFGAVEAAASELGAPPVEVRDIMFGPYAEDTEHPWHKLERGEISLAAARREIRALGKQRGYDFEPVKLLAGTVSETGPRDLLVERVRGLQRDGYRTAIVTNNVAEFKDHWRALIPVDELFELVIDSCEVGVRKPNPEIYRLALDQLGVAPERAIFLDDFEQNVRVAVQLGMRGVLVGTDMPAVINELDCLLSGRS